MVISLDKIIKDYDLKIKGVIHIGAHWGQEYKDYARHGILNLMFFEPAKNNFEMLKARLPEDDNVKLFNLALGNEVGTKEMFIETRNNGQSNSILEPRLHLKQYPWISFDKKEKIRIDRLDNVPFDPTLYNMINIDVQGYELEVFKGAFDTLNHIDIIYSEVNLDEVYKGCAKVDEIDLFLSQWGFDRVLTDWIGETWGDALYLKNKI